MNPYNPDEPTPTVADEASTLVDDEQVISKTLPSTSTPVPLQAHVDRTLGAVREFAIAQPMRALLIAAVAGAALSTLVSAWLRDPGVRRHCEASPGGR